MGAGASSRGTNKPEVHVVVVQQRPAQDNATGSNVAVNSNNMSNEIVHTALKAAKLVNAKETRYTCNSYGLCFQ